MVGYLTKYLTKSVAETYDPDTITARQKVHRDRLPRGTAARPSSRSRNHLLLAGVAVHVVAERLGHADPSITLRVYAHVIRKHAEGIADAFADAMDSADDDDGSAGVPAVPC